MAAGQPTYGPSLRAWREQERCHAAEDLRHAGHGGRLRAVLVGAHPSWPLALGVGLFFIASAAYVLSRPSPRAQAPSGGPDDA